MTLTTCKKCGKIFPSDAMSCPYCGATMANITNGDKDATNQYTGGLGIGFFLLVALFLILAVSNSKNTDVNRAPEKNCQLYECGAGSLAITDTPKQKPYYTCKSEALSNYSNYVLDVMFANVQFTGFPPKVSNKTGEPDVQGEEKKLLGEYRTLAGVSTFEEAISQCYKGVGNTKVIVLYNPKKSNSIYVYPESNQEDKFWLPKVRLNKRQEASPGSGTSS